MPEWSRRVEPEQAGQRVDVFLAAFGPLSRSAVQRLIAEDRVLVDGFTARKNYRVSEGEVLLVIEPEPAPAEALPEEIPLDILYEDADLIVLNKPRGLVVHPAPGHESGTLVNALLHHCGEELSGIGGVRRPGIVHRIDKNTSGLMVAAKNDLTHVTLSAALKKHEIVRQYEAVARGHFDREEFTISAPLGRHPVDRKRQAVIPDGREAVTHVTELARYSGYTHIKCLLETGRTHQIRVHLSSIGHPLAGDAVYGGKEGELGLDGQCLHARRLAFCHPRTGVSMEFDSGLPPWFEAVLKKLKA